MKHFFTILAASAFSQLGISYAQTTDTIKTLLLEETIIIDNFLKTDLGKSNREVQIIDKQTIAKLPVRTIDELLRYANGIDIRQRGAAGVQADVSIDGGTFDQSMVLVNGMIVTDAQTGHNMMLLPFSLTDIERIEIIRGSAASLYGVNALLGAINIVTKKELVNEVVLNGNFGTANYSDTSNNFYYDYLLNAAANLITGKLIQRFSTQLAQGNGYQYNTAFENYKLYYTGQLDLSKRTNVFYQLGYAKNSFGANGFYAAPGDKNAHEDVTTFLGMTQINHAVTNNWNTSFKYGYQYKLDDYKYIVEPLVGNNIHNNNAHQFEWANRFVTNIGKFNAGLAFRNEDIISTNLGNRNRTNYGMFAGYQKDLSNLNFKIHAYLNSNSQYGWQLYPGFDIGGKLIKDMKWFVNGGMGQRLPTFTDLYYKQANLIVGNPDLKPEHSVSFNAGLNFRSNEQLVQTTFFYRTVNQFIDWVKNTPTEPWQPNNFQTLNTFGWSASLENSYELQSNVFKKIQYKVNYNFLLPTIQTDASYQISRYAINSLKHQLIMYASLLIGDHIIFSPSIRYYKRVSYKDYWLISARLMYQQKVWNCYLDFDNILNEKVVEAGANPLPGSWVRLGVQLKFK